MPYVEELVSFEDVIYALEWGNISINIADRPHIPLFRALLTTYCKSQVEQIMVVLRVHG